MNNMPIEKYQPFPQISLPNRQWPLKTITKAPLWCSVDLRDGNQALINPMSLEQKLEMFDLLIQLGFKEIEIGFPSASKVEYDFLRTLIDENRIPDDVTVQVLTQAREHLIKKTFESLKGCKKAVVHLYNSTSTLQRSVVFNMNRAEIKEIAVNGAKLLVEFAKTMEDTDLTFEYSPESFTGTELDYALEVCEAVLDVWQPTPEKRTIINLPATVEMHTPNIHADQVEWFCNNLKNRESVILSVHPHNDRGTAVAAAELALMAGADRVEGTLFGNGERTGNVDLLVLGLNLFSQGVDPHLDFSDVDHVMKVYRRCTDLDIHVRHPYVGDLVYTAFSGSHQDAINKGMKRYEEDKSENKIWAVPYLPIDPKDVGRDYEAIIRINSQSGKGGVAYIMSQEFGYNLPKTMHPEFGRVIQEKTDELGREIISREVHECFKAEYLQRNSPYRLGSFSSRTLPTEQDNTCDTEIEAAIFVNDEEVKLKGTGNGPIDAFSNALREKQTSPFRVVSYHQHAMEKGSTSTAATYIQLETEQQEHFYGVGVDSNTNASSFKAILSALNRIEAI